MGREAWLRGNSRGREDLSRDQRTLRLDRFREHDVEIVVGVLDAKKNRSRLNSPQRPPSSETPAESHADQTPSEIIDETLKLGDGTLLALDNHGKVSIHSTERSCPKCGRSFEPLDPKNFSYNSPQGWCPRCRGFGELFYMPEDVDRGAREDAIAESWYELAGRRARAFARIAMERD